MKIVTLIEDTQKDTNLGCEHGVSFYIETENHKVLFDLGQGSLFAKNAKKLSIDIQAVDTVIISHGHYDHGGGLEELIRLNKTAKIYIQKDAFGDFYSWREDNAYTYIGLSKKIDQSRLILLDDDLMIDDELMLFKHIASRDYYPNSNHTMYKKEKDQFILDEFTHEQNLIVKENNKIALFTGCSHHGIINIINQAEQILKKQKIQAVFGGFHLKSRFKAYEETLENILFIGHILNKKNVDEYYSGHCTGTMAFEYLKSILKDKLIHFQPGFSVNL